MENQTGDAVLNFVGGFGLLRLLLGLALMSLVVYGVGAAAGVVKKIFTTPMPTLKPTGETFLRLFLLFGGLVVAYVVAATALALVARVGKALPPSAPSSSSVRALDDRLGRDPAHPIVVSKGGEWCIRLVGCEGVWFDAGTTNYQVRIDPPVRYQLFATYGKVAEVSPDHFDPAHPPATDAPPLFRIVPEHDAVVWVRRS